MADNLQKRDERDRSRVSASEDYEIRYFAEHNGITMDQARDLVRRFGGDRKKLNEEARRLKRH
jgi:hypothetical protein